MTAKLFGCALVLTLSCHSLANERAVKTMDLKGFQSLSASTMDPSMIYYTENIVPFAAWNAAEKQILSLTPDYVEPTVVAERNGVRKDVVEKLTVYITRHKAVVNKPAQQINLAKLITLDSVNKLDPEIKHRPVQEPQFIYNVVGKGPVNNFQWCNTAGKNPSIVRPGREIDLSYLVPKGRKWCDQPDRSLCVESCYPFGTLWSGMVGAANLALGEAEKKDFGVALQTEIRYLTSEAEYGNRAPLHTLTQLQTPVRGIIELNMFYFNQVLQFGKVVAIFQEHPTDAGKTVVTSLITLGIKSRTWDKYPIIADVLKGQSSLANSKTGLTAGIPIFSQNVSKAIIKNLEN